MNTSYSGWENRKRFPGRRSNTAKAWKLRDHREWANLGHWNMLFVSYIKEFEWDFPGSSAGEESACNVGDLGLIPRLGQSPGEGKGYPLQYSGLENPMDCIVWLSDFHFTSLHSSLPHLPFIWCTVDIIGPSLVAQSVKNLPAMQETRVQSLGWEDPLEKEMATHSSILAWKIS